MARRVLFAVVGWGLALVTMSCESAGQSSSSCPPCECACEQGAGSGGSSPAPAGAQQPVGDTPTVAASGDALELMRQLSELTASASRKMFHEDGRGCLADLGRIRAIDPTAASRLAVTQGQCEMLVGRCQSGKARISAWYQRETAMTKARADATAEQLGAMRCRGGDASDRDRLLGALHDLSDAAYVNPRTPAYCEARLSTVRELLPRVPAKGADDTQISGGGKALFHTGAACFVKAGDCRQAYRAYAKYFPREGLSGIKDAAVRNKAVRDSFESSFAQCAAKP